MPSSCAASDRGTAKRDRAMRSFNLRIGVRVCSQRHQVGLSMTDSRFSCCRTILRPVWALRLRGQWCVRVDQ